MLKREGYPVHGMKAYRDSRDIAPFILNLGTRRLYVQERTHWTAGLVDCKAGLDVSEKTVFVLLGFFTIVDVYDIQNDKYL
jgi:hypothetical protein